jgi:hypothetical protein
VNFFWRGVSSRAEAEAEVRQTSEAKKETYASCIVLNFSYYEAPTFYNIKRIAKTRAVSRACFGFWKQQPQ